MNPIVCTFERKSYRGGDGESILEQNPLLQSYPLRLPTLLMSLQAESLQTAIIGSRVIEAAENYARATPVIPEEQKTRSRQRIFYEDQQFWAEVFSDNLTQWGSILSFYFPVVFSEWVARVPGLYWRSDRATLRRYNAGEIERVEGANVTLRPLGKSRLVIGGVGTLRIPPSERGYRLCSITTSANVSAGVPVLISPEAWDPEIFQEGAVLSLPPLRWEQMPHEWAGRFPSIAGIPRGVLRIDSAAEIRSKHTLAAAHIHPFALMEYHDGNAEFFAFVFATAIAAEETHRRELERFFARYCCDQGRDGRYLTSADISEPLWNADYLSPEDLLRSDPVAGSQLRLLERRVREAHLGGRTLDLILEALGSLPNDGHLARLSTKIGIPPSRWRGAGTVAGASARFLDQVPHEKLDELIDAIARDYPALVSSPTSPSA